MWGNIEPRGRLGLPGAGSGFPHGLDLDLYFDLAWVGAVLCSCFLTSAPGCGGEVRKCLAERVGRHPARPAAVAAVWLPRTAPVRAGGPLHGGCAADVCPLYVPGSGVSPGVVSAKGRPRARSTGVTNTRREPPRGREAAEEAGQLAAKVAGAAPSRGGSFRRALRAEALRRGGCRARLPRHRPRAVPAVPPRYRACKRRPAVPPRAGRSAAGRRGRNAAHGTRRPLQPQQCFASRCARRAAGLGRGSARALGPNEAGFARHWWRVPYPSCLRMASFRIGRALSRLTVRLLTGCDCGRLGRPEISSGMMAENLSDYLTDSNRYRIAYQST